MRPNTQATPGQLTVVFLAGLSFLAWFAYEVRDLLGNRKKVYTICAQTVPTTDVEGEPVAQQSPKTELQVFRRLTRVYCLKSSADAEVFFLLLWYVYLSDGKKVWPLGERVYDKDFFLFLFLGIVGLASLTMSNVEFKETMLNRNQTEVGYLLVGY